jgi:hypothetical protein
VWYKGDIIAERWGETLKQATPKKEVLMITKLVVFFIVGLLFLMASDVLAQTPSASGKGGAQSGSKTPEIKPSSTIREQDKTTGAYKSEGVKKYEGLS